MTRYIVATPPGPRDPRHTALDVARVIGEAVR